MTSARQDSLFAPDEVAPVRVGPAARVRAAVTRGTRPEGWRPVTDPGREQACRVCDGAASCGVGEAWFCVPHAPPEFWPQGSAMRGRA